VSVFTEETAYGFSSRFNDWSGVSTPTSVPPAFIRLMPPTP
jgi:hypothetical protein